MAKGRAKGRATAGRIRPRVGGSPQRGYPYLTLGIPSDICEKLGGVEHIRETYEFEISITAAGLLYRPVRINPEYGWETSEGENFEWLHRDVNSRVS